MAGRLWTDDSGEVRGEVNGTVTQSGGDATRQRSFEIAVEIDLIYWIGHWFEFAHTRDANLHFSGTGEGDGPVVFELGPVDSQIFVD
jgi:hypothetical protein